MINEHDIKDMWPGKYKTPKRIATINGVVKTANDKQVAGDHYKKYGGLQPWDVITAWGLGYLDGTALKYIARWRDKGGIDDIRKAIHFLEKFIEVETAKNDKN
jgi:hypothetical protein